MLRLLTIKTILSGLSIDPEGYRLIGSLRIEIGNRETLCILSQSVPLAH